MQTKEEFYSEEGKRERERRIKILMNCGIYWITNLVNYHRYIGSSRNIKQRFSQHKSALRHNKHRNKHLQNAWNLYGEENFLFQHIDHIAYPEKLIQRENNSIRIYKPEYNNIQVNKDHLFFHSDETKKKIGLKSREKFIRNPELTQKLIDSKKDKDPWNKGKKNIYSDITLKKMSDCKKGKTFMNRRKPVQQYDLEGNFIKEWSGGITEISEFYGITSTGNFSTAIKTGIKLYNSYWRRKDGNIKERFS